MIRPLQSLTILATIVVAASPVSADKPITPTKVIKLAPGDSLENFYTWLKKTEYKDPQGVFGVSDGVIHVSGDDAGYLATKRAYRDYHLVMEFKWGKLKRPSKYVRNSGLLLHGVGPDGAAGGVWMASVECQLAQGCEGDFILIRGRDKQGNRISNTITSEIEIGADNRPRWKPGGEKRKYWGRQIWWNKHQVGFKELIDTRGKDDVASPLGEWTQVEAICDGDTITIKINGTTVNKCFDVKPAAGKILLQSEGYEIYFRNVELRPLKRESE